jgi:large subunit ribosomal protein L27
MAKTKAAGATKLGRDSRPKYLGIKIFDGQKVKVGQILVRQRGSKLYPGENVRKAGDDSLYSTKEGIVRFTTKKKISFNNSQKKVKIVNVE